MDRILRERITLAHFKTLAAYRESRNQFLNGGEKDVKYSVALKFAMEFIDDSTPTNLIDSFIELIELKNPIKDTFDGFNYSTLTEENGMKIKIPFVEIDFERNQSTKKKKKNRKHRDGSRTVKEVLQDARYSAIYKLRCENRGVDYGTFLKVESRGAQLFELWKTEFLKLNGAAAMSLLEGIEYPSFKPSAWLNAEGLREFNALK